MKTNVLFSFLIVILVLSCSKSDDSDGDQLPTPDYRVTFDQGTANEQAFQSDYPELRWLCQYATILTDPVQGSNGTMQGALLNIPGGFAIQDNFTFSIQESFYDGDSYIYPEAIFVVDGVQFEAVSGSITITDYDDSRFEASGDILLNGNAILSIENSDGSITRTVNVTFTNIKRTFSGSC